MALRNNSRVTKKFLITKFDCIYPLSRDPHPSLSVHVVIECPPFPHPWNAVHIRQRPHGIKNLDNQIYGLIIIFMASRHVFECEIEYLVVKSCHIWFKWMYIAELGEGVSSQNDGFSNILCMLNWTTLLSVFMNILIENWDTET